MIDRREAILARLMEIFSEVPGIKTAARNREDVSGGKSTRPAIIMHDGAESTSGLNNRPLRSPHDMMVLTPQIFILLGDRSSVVGTDVSQYRSTLIPIIYGDSILRNLIGGGRGAGDIHYTGCGLDTTTGETREARLEVNFEFTYTLDINELTL